MLETDSDNKLHCVATVRGKDTRLAYDADNGILRIQGDAWEEIIDNRNVIAVVDGKDDGDSSKTTSCQILLISGLPGKQYRFEDVRVSKLPADFVDAHLISPRFASLVPGGARGSASNLSVVISTGSGTGEAQGFFDDVVKPACTAIGLQEFAYYVHITDSDKSIEIFAQAVLFPRANKGIYQTVLLLSGDGAVVDLVNVLLSGKRSSAYIKPTIGLLTMGTGNALANSTGLNFDLTRGLRHFFRGQPHSLPTFTATFSPNSWIIYDEGRKVESLSSAGDTRTVYGAVVCSWALHASLVADSDTTEYRKHGSQRFQMAAKDLLAPPNGTAPHIYKGEITLFKLDEYGEVVRHVLESREYMYMLATLVSNLEEKFTVSPYSKPLDGQLRLVHLGAVSSVEVMKIMGLAFQGGAHVGDEAVGYESIEGMRIDFHEPDSRWRRVCVDGRIVQVGENGWVEVRRNVGVDVLDIVADLEM